MTGQATLNFTDYRSAQYRDLSNRKQLRQKLEQDEQISLGSIG